jgi:hypothetical protein
MSDSDSIEDVLRNWPYDPSDLRVRLIECEDGREVLQMRIDLGILQLETTKRPDGTRPHGAETYFDYLVEQAISFGDEFVMDDEQCAGVDREFVQFYHRRISWLSLKMYDRAVVDAEHTLSLMDFCRDHSPEEDWTLNHEQYRPFVMFHRAQAAALHAIGEKGGDGPEYAIEILNENLNRFRQLYIDHDAESEFENDELVKRLEELRESLRDEHEIGRTLQERLEDAVASEHYETAAELRDELQRRSQGD